MNDAVMPLRIAVRMTATVPVVQGNMCRVDVAPRMGVRVSPLGLGILLRGFMPEGFPWFFACMLVLVYDDLAIDENVAKAGRILVGFFERGVVLYPFGIEHGDVGPVAGLDQSSAVQLKRAGGK